MLTPRSVASVVTSASTPTRSGTGTLHLRQVRGPGQPAGQVAPVLTGPFEQGQERAPVVEGHGVPQLGDRGDQPVEHRHDGRPVLAADVGPDARMPGGDAGHVPESAGRQPQHGLPVVVALRRQPISAAAVR